MPHLNVEFRSHGVAKTLVHFTKTHTAVVHVSQRDTGNWTETRWCCFVEHRFVAQGECSLVLRGALPCCQVAVPQAVHHRKMTRQICVASEA